jgi:hypothetical protein
LLSADNACYFSSDSHRLGKAAVEPVKILSSKYKEALQNMAVISPILYKSIATVCLTSLFSLGLYDLEGVAWAQMIKSSKSLFSSQQENFQKCGWKPKINLKLPLWHLLAKRPGSGGNRVEPLYRCGYSGPIRLTALIPQSNVGITVAQYPTLFFYIPNVNLEGVTAELSIVNNEGEEVYKTVKLKSPDRIVSINFSDFPSLPPLEVGKSYPWSFQAIVDEENRGDGPRVTGWIKRVSLDSKLQHKLETALPQEKPAIYASNGLWYDALTSLAKLRCSYPNNPTFSSDWESLLQQVELPTISTKPFAQCN